MPTSCACCRRSWRRRATAGTARRVGLLDHRASGASTAAVRRALRAAAGRRRLDRDRRRDRQRRPAALAAAVEDLPLLCAGSGLAIGLPANFGIAPSSAGGDAAAGRRPLRDRLGQLLGGDQRAGRALLDGGGAARRIDPLRARRGPRRRRSWPRSRAGPPAQWAKAPARPVLVYSTAPAETVAAAQAQARRRRRRRAPRGAPGRCRHGAGRAAARAAWSIAGGETSGACVQALGVRELRIGAQIDPGVPWCHAAPALGARRPAPGAEVGQLRRASTSSAAPSRSRHERSGAARRDRAASADRCMRAATCTARPATSARA